MTLAPLFAAPPRPHAANPRLTVEVDGDEVLDRYGVQWQDVFGDLGSGEFTILNSNSAAAMLTTGQTVVFRLDGDAFLAWVINGRRRTTVAENEEGEEETTYYGETTLAELKKAIIYPANGVHDVTSAIFTGRLGTKPYAPDRYFGPMEPGWDITGWSAATQVVHPTGTYAPENYPDGSAYWIGSSDDVVHFRKTFTTSGVFTIKVFFAAANAAQIFVDGVLVTKVDEEIDGDAATKTRSVKVQVTDGTHTIYARVARGAKPDSLFVCTVYELGTTTVLARTNNTWKTTTAVAVTPGYVLDRALTEAQGRGRLTGWTWDFDTTDDTAGRPWPSLGDWYPARVKDTVLQLAQALREGWIELHALPAAGGRVLSAWVAEGVTDGADATAPGYTGDTGVAIVEGDNATQIVHEETAAESTVVLLEFSDGYIEGQLDDAVAAYGAMELGLDLSNYDGPQSLYVAEANLRPVAQPELSITAEFVPQPADLADQVAVVTGLGHTVTIPAMDTGTPTAYRIKAHSGAEDDNGQLKVRPELDSARDIIEQRFHRSLIRIANGTNNGRSASATVSSRSVADAQVVNRLGGLDFSTGGGYSIVGDRGSARRPSEPALVVRFDVDLDVAGISGTTTYRVEVDGSSIGTISIASGADTASVTLASPVYVDTTNLMNIECTAAGGHTGVTVKVTAVPIG